MKTAKTIIIVFLLIALTCSVVFVPQFLSGQKEKDALETVTSRSYSAGERTEIISEQVARLYYNNEVVTNEATDTAKISVDDVLGAVFSDDETIYKPMQAIIDNGDVNYTRENILVNIDNQPTTLSFVDCYVENSYGCCKVGFEEKTNTLISISFNFAMDNFSYDGTVDNYVKEVESIMTNYYETKLKMGKDEYYYNAITPDETSTGDWFDIFAALNTNDKRTEIY